MLQFRFDSALHKRPISSLNYGFQRSTAYATCHRQHDAGDVAGAHRRGQEHISGRQFLGLRPVPHFAGRAEFLDRHGVLVGQVQRRPDRSGRHRIDANPPVEQVPGQRFGERNSRNSRRRVIEQLGAALQPRERAGIDDARPFSQVRQGGLGHVEIAVDVGTHGFVEALFGDVFKRIGVLALGQVLR